MNKHRGSDFDAIMGDYELPDPPENPDFVELFTPEQQDVIADRFARGIALGEARLREARLRETRSADMARARKERRAIARETYLKSRFNPVLPHTFGK